jgi:hypothetical protein
VINNYDVTVYFDSRTGLFAGYLIEFAIVFEVVGNGLDLKLSFVCNFLLFYGLFLLLLHFFHCEFEDFGMLFKLMES